ncbi:MAG TPA: YetF domain-containing protein [Allosphingosinicella sp.]|nr:YetF domain-containing protein [Allosphingosinicella sp.]
MLDLPEPYGALVRGVLLTAIAVLWTVLLVRIVGLRAFSKMTAFDFVTTIATGSLIAQAGTRSDGTEFLQALAAIAGVFLIQWILAKARQKSDGIQKLIKNTPVLLMEDGKFLEDAMSASRVSRSSILEKIRAANAPRLSAVRAVVLETTGNISILHGEDFDERLLEGVKRL